MRLRNRDGDPVDPVPYLVVASIGFLLSFSVIPGYALSLGVRPTLGLVAAAVAFAGIAAVTYRRMVRTHDPTVRQEIDPALRIQTLFYAVAIAGVVLVSLSLLLLRP